MSQPKSSLLGTMVLSNDGEGLSEEDLPCKIELAICVL